MEWHSKGITHEDIVMASFYLTEVRTNPPIVIDMLVGKARAENQHCYGAYSDQSLARLRVLNSVKSNVKWNYFFRKPLEQ